MTDWNAGQIITIVTVFIAGVIQIINLLRTNELKRQQEASVVKIDTVAKDTEAIKGHVNSEKTAAEGRQRLLENENQLLRTMVADKKETAALLAQASATRQRETVASPTTPAVDATLEKIEANTAAIDENTKK